MNTCVTSAAAGILNAKPSTFREQIASLREALKKEAEKLALFEARIKDLGLLDKSCNFLTIWDLSED